MIIVLTKNATVFINEKEYRSVTHDKDNECITAIHKANDFNGPVDTEYVNDVVSVHYYSDSVEVNFHDEGNELKNLNEAYSTLLKQFDRLRKDYLDLGVEKINLAAKVDDLKKQLAKYEAK